MRWYIKALIFIPLTLFGIGFITTIISCVFMVFLADSKREREREELQENMRRDVDATHQYEAEMNRQADLVRAYDQAHRKTPKR